MNMGSNIFQSREKALYNTRDRRRLVRSALTLPQRSKEISFSKTYDGKKHWNAPKSVLDAPKRRVSGLCMKGRVRQKMQGHQDKSHEKQWSAYLSFEH